MNIYFWRRNDSYRFKDYSALRRLRSRRRKMVDFHGWLLPVQFKGILAEHKAVREAAGMFDVSHMGQFL